MGTRADFYVGRGEKAEWLGSTAWDGYPDGFEGTGILEARTEAEYRDVVAKEIGDRKDGTKPEDGWPWPWEDSQTTDYSYAFDGDKVHGSCFGREWFDPLAPQPDLEGVDTKPTVFPNMKDRAKPAPYGSKRSGGILLSTK